MSLAHIKPDAEQRWFVLPEPRGPWTERLFPALLGDPGAEIDMTGLPTVRDPLGDDDLQLALYVCYELHYADIQHVSPRWEWAPSLLRLRAALEAQTEEAVWELVQPATAEDVTNVGESLHRIIAEDDGPPLSRFIETQGTLGQMREHIVHRSAYQLKEADPHTWAIPRLSAVPKAALLEIQADEYGGGSHERMHSALFAQTMSALELDPSYGAYLGMVPGITLATVNLMSRFGLHRRLRGALVGHLSGLEMTSSIPNRRYGNALRRLGYGPEATRFYDEHVQADAVHETIAAWDLAGGLARAEPEMAADILFGARALLAVENRWAQHLIDHWTLEVTSLLAPLDSA
jgi:Iron-containing redox enzyme